VKSNSLEFSFNNYADYYQSVNYTGSPSKSHRVLKRRATQYIATVKALSRENWATIFKEGASYIKPLLGVSPHGGEMVEDIIQEDENYREFVLESD